jgi:hypothetical protein
MPQPLPQHVDRLDQDLVGHKDVALFALQRLCRGDSRRVIAVGLDR